MKLSNYRAYHKENLKRHSKSKHEGVKYAFSECDYEASYKENLKRHSKSKHDPVNPTPPESKIEECNSGDFGLKEKRNLLKPKKTIQKSRGIKYSCDQCDFEAPEKSHIYIHVKYIHEGVRRYPCGQLK